MHEKIIDGSAVAKRHDLGVEPVQADALVAVLAEDQRLAVLQVEGIIGLDALVGGVLEDAVVEDLAILVDLDKRGALVGCRPPQRLGQVVDIDVNSTGDKGRLSADGERQGPQRIVDGTQRTRLGARAGARGWRVLALGQAVNLVVEEDDLEIDVAANGVDQVIAADGQPVAIAGDNPDLEVGAASFQARGEGRRAPVNAVEAVSVHVVRKPARAADARNEHHLFAGKGEARQRLLHLG